MSRLLLWASLCMAGLPAVVHGQVMSCQPSGAKSAALRNEVIGYLTDSAYVSFRGEFNIANPDTAQVTIVTQDSICDAVTRGVNSASITQRTSSLIVVKFGAFYAAAVPEGLGIVGVFILDDQARLKTVMVST